MFRISALKHTTVSVLFLAAWAANAFAFSSALFGAILLVCYVLWFGLLIGRGLLPQEHPALRGWFGSWILLSAIALVGSAVYYLAVITPTVVQAMVLLTAPVALWISRHDGVRGWFSRPHDFWHNDEHRTPAWVWMSFACIAVLFVSLFTVVARSATTDAVRSLWLVVPASVFVAAFLLFLLLSAHLMRGQERAIVVPLVMVALFLLISTALFVFPIGYGFDSFIHQATETHIAEFGTITPKPFYYIGQYALVLFATHGFAIPIAWADRLLVPLLAAFFLPLAWYAAAAHLTPSRRVATATLVGLFLIPLASFIVTTPQGLANLWTLLLILAAVPYLMRAERPRVMALVLPALATLVIHPIAGIPALLFLCLVASEPRLTNERLVPVARVLFWLIAVAGAVALPASFVVNNIRSGSATALNLSALNPATLLSALHIDLFFENRYNPVLDFAYLYGFNAILLLVLLALAGWWLARHDEAKRLRVLVVMGFILLVNFLLLSTAVDFSFLIDYERQGYADRLIPLIAFFLSPLAMVAIGRIRVRLLEAPIALRIGSVVLAAALVTASWYFAYPRHDSYAASHGFNVAQSDIDAVYAIDDDAQGMSYVVLANQSVSAAAIRELGFAHYFGDVFFYPIPTGGDLYEQFLAMNETPTREIAMRAAEIADEHCLNACTQKPVEAVYYVVNDYWWQADRLIESGKQTADDWFSIDDGRVSVFKYDLDLAADHP